MSPHAADIVRVVLAPSSANPSGPAATDVEGSLSESGGFSNVVSHRLRKTYVVRIGDGNRIALEVRRETRRGPMFGGVAVQILCGEASRTAS